MSRIEGSAERLIEAPSDAIYAFLKDLSRRPEILPCNYTDFRVEEGPGAGGVMCFFFRSRRHSPGRAFRVRVEETEPGRILTERDETSSFVSVWTLVPSGVATGVRIQSSWEGGSSPARLVERLFAPILLRRIYHDVLQRLARAFTVEKRVP